MELRRHALQARVDFPLLNELRKLHLKGYRRLVVLARQLQWFQVLQVGFPLLLGDLEVRLLRWRVQQLPVGVCNLLQRPRPDNLFLGKAVLHERPVVPERPIQAVPQRAVDCARSRIADGAFAPKQQRHVLFHQVPVELVPRVDHFLLCLGRRLLDHLTDCVDKHQVLAPIPTLDLRYSLRSDRREVPRRQLFPQLREHGHAARVERQLLGEPRRPRHFQGFLMFQLPAVEQPLHRQVHGLPFDFLVVLFVHVERLYHFLEVAGHVFDLRGNELYALLFQKLRVLGQQPLLPQAHGNRHLLEHFQLVPHLSGDVDNCIPCLLQFNLHPGVLLLVSFPHQLVDRIEPVLTLERDPL
ncbi:uncharacterized protein BcabD6B2_10650 [Babesia caballi]|uniref:Uncharacterized protein n=1 Tax=Babesia caballi TaxID=5871 RepID=A0AAV4LNV5_BABCB|nr:hypothetical protein BcabD6B2_10650 [Babesia caballi]